MLGPIGAEIMGIFRLLSPDEIDRYIVPDAERRVEGTMKMASGGESMQFNDEQPHLENSVKKEPEQPEKFPKDHQAKIIPLHEFKEKNKITEKAQEPSFKKADKKEQAPSRQGNSDSSDLASIGVLSASMIRDIEGQRRQEENSNKDSATVFLLKEREKMRISKKRMIEQQAIKSYQVNAEQEFHEESDESILEEGEGSSDLKGILLNKRHY